MNYKGNCTYNKLKGCHVVQFQELKMAQEETRTGGKRATTEFFYPKNRGGEKKKPRKRTYIIIEIQSLEAK